MSEAEIFITLLFIFGYSSNMSFCDIYHPQGFYKCKINQSEWSWDKLVMHRPKVWWNALFCLMLRALLKKRDGDGEWVAQNRATEKLWDKLCGLAVLPFCLTCPNSQPDELGLSPQTVSWSGPAPLLQPRPVFPAFSFGFFVLFVLLILAY